jgi:hypothetical protein
MVSSDPFSTKTVPVDANAPHSHGRSEKDRGSDKKLKKAWSTPKLSIHVVNSTAAGGNLVPDGVLVGGVYHS